MVNVTVESKLGEGTVSLVFADNLKRAAICARRQRQVG